MAKKVTTTVVKKDTKNEALVQQGSMILACAHGLTIASGAEYAYAGDLVRTIKSANKQVVDFFEPMRASTKKAYDDVLTQKKKMLGGLEEAEKIVKAKIADYILEQDKVAEHKRLAMAEEIKSEIRKKEDELALTVGSDTETIEYLRAEIEGLQNSLDALVAMVEIPRTEGVSISRTWKIKNIDPNTVPDVYDGIVLRPVDEGAVMKLIKASNGTVNIPGIIFEQSCSVIVRSD